MIPARARSGLGDRSARLPALLFAAAAVAAVPLWLWAGRKQWFFQDEFAVLARPVREPADLFTPHNEHLIVPARAMYGVWWELFGLRQYVPYQIVVVLAHVLLAVLVRIVMVRAGVSGWVASAAALVLLTFGRGYEDVIWAFQITFTGSVAAGYLHVLLADHDGPLGRRDVAGLLAGAVAVTSAGTGIVMVFAVGLSTLVRRGPRVAAFHTLPLLVPLGIWFLARPDGPDGSAPRAVLAFVRNGLEITADRATAGPIATLVIAGCVVVGLGAAVRAEGVPAFARRTAVPLGLAVACLVNWSMIGYSRAEGHGVQFAERPRYSHVALALALPLVAVGIDGLVRRQRLLLVPVLAVLLAAVPANIRSVEVRSTRMVPNDLLLAMARSPFLEGSSPDRVLFPGVTGYQQIEAGWLLGARRDGKIPDDEVPQWAVTEATHQLALEEVPAPEADPVCRVVDHSEVIVLDRGDRVTLKGSWLVWVDPAESDSWVRPGGGWSPVALVSTADDLSVTIAPFEKGSGERCDPP